MYRGNSLFLKTGEQIPIEKATKISNVAYALQPHEGTKLSISWINLKKSIDSVNNHKLIEVLNSTGIPRKINRQITKCMVETAYI